MSVNLTRLNRRYLKFMLLLQHTLSTMILIRIELLPKLDEKMVLGTLFWS